jgi:hypothetical protein
MSQRRYRLTEGAVTDNCAIISNCVNREKSFKAARLLYE